MTKQRIRQRLFSALLSSVAGDPGISYSQNQIENLLTILTPVVEEMVNLAEDTVRLEVAEDLAGIDI